MHPLLDYIKSYTSTGIPEADFEVIKSYFIPRKLRKRQYFLQQGEVYKYFGFVVKGAIRQYFVDDKGTEHFVQLSLENWWIGDRESSVNLSRVRKQASLK